MMVTSDSPMKHLKTGVQKEEARLRQEIRKEEAGLKWFFGSHTFRVILALLLFTALLCGVYYWAVQEGRIYVEDAQISAPVITLSSQQPGILEDVYVLEGDTIPANTVVARVDGVPIKSQIAGIVIDVQNTPGQYVSPQNAIVKMIDPDELRVVGRVQEDKGLAEIKKGQRVLFTADAFGSKEYAAVVDRISPVARSGDIVFSISDKRQEQEFDVSAHYPSSSYPELKQGMSAKMWIYK